MRTRIPIFLSVAAVLAVFGAGQAQGAITHSFSFGGSGTGPGQFSGSFDSGPNAVAVNHTTGDIYVTDEGNNRVQQFDADGNFIRMWGWDVDADDGSAGFEVCTAASGHLCQAGAARSDGGALNHPGGIAVDNSGGPDDGSVYVFDKANRRIQRYTEEGQFVLMWGKDVNLDTGGNVCTAASGDTCVSGGITGDAETNPPTPSAPGEYSGADPAQPGPLTTDGAGNVYWPDLIAVPESRVQKFNSSGDFLGQIAGFWGLGDSETTGFGGVAGMVATASGDLWVVDQGPPGCMCPSETKKFSPSDFSPDGVDAAFDLLIAPRSGQQQLAVDPTNDFLVSWSDPDVCDRAATGKSIVIYDPDGAFIDCTTSDLISSGWSDGIAASPQRRLYIPNAATQQLHVFELPTPQAPTVGGQSATEITSNKAVVKTDITPNYDYTTYHVEYGLSPCSDVPNPCASTEESSSIGASVFQRSVTEDLADLTPSTTYHYRIVASNGQGEAAGPDRLFTTFASPPTSPDCPNDLARQQTGAAFLLDCRAYELVSASDQGGYNVASDLVAGQEPYGGFPRAQDKALYAVHNGGIPGTGNPTNRGPDPYLATRDAENQRWVTDYVGIPANVSVQPFSSTLAGADSSLSSFAFGGPEFCDPCLPDGSSGIPLRRPDGSLIQGMQGSQIQVLDPEPAGEVKKHLSDDGTNFVFASKQVFVPGANNSGTDVTIYNRDLATNITRIASRLPNTTVIQNGEDVVALDLSADGNRTLIGNLLSTDAEGNRYFHLYMNSPIGSVDVTPGTTTGVLYAGMNDAGTRVFFTTPDSLLGDSDTSADLYMASVGSSPAASLTRVSTGTGGSGNTDSCDPAANSYNTEDWNVIPGGPTDCSVVAIGGQGGVARENGTVYFLSPEQLDGNGIDGAPNVFVARPGVSPELVETLESTENEPLKPEEHLFQRSYGSFSYPEGVAIDADDGSTYVYDTVATTDGETPGAYVQKFDAQGNPDLDYGANSRLTGTPPGIAGPFLALGEGRSEIDPTGRPTQVAVDNSGSVSDGSLYVPDYGGDGTEVGGAVYKFNPSGGFIGQLNLSFGFAPSGVAVNQSNGNVHATTDATNEVYVFTPNGFPSTSFSVTGPALGVAVDSSGNSYVVNGDDTRVYDSSGTFVEVFDTAPSFGVAVDPTDDHVYVDHGDEVVEYDETGAEVETIGVGRLGDSVSLAAHGGRLEISNPDRGKVASYTPPTIPPSGAYDSPLVINSVRDAETRHTADFQTTPDGNHAAFSSGIPLTGFDSDSHYEVFRHDALAGQTECLSCNPTDTPPTSDASLASDGLSITDDGRVFFNSGEALVLRDTNSRRDVYEWSEEAGRSELISSGQDPFDSSLLSVSADGTDAFFFTRETLTSNDKNGNLTKLYTAREGGGFFTIPPQPPCAASDECHGPGSEVAPPVNLGTLEGSGGNAPQPQAGQDDRCNTRKLARRARGFSKRAKALRRRAVRSSNRRATRRIRIRVRRFSRAARKNATAAKRCRARTRARRAAR